MKSIFSYIFLLLAISSCHRADEDKDVLAQEEISNIILLVKDDTTGVVKVYDYTANAVQNPSLVVENGKSYTVDVIFKNGNEDLNDEIIEAKDEHFIVFRVLNANIQIVRVSDAGDVRADGNRVGLKTKWQINSINSNAQIILTLNHAAVSVSEAQNNTTFGSAEGGETDAEAFYNLLN
jgi:hypothetical protein